MSMPKIAHLLDVKERTMLRDHLVGIYKQAMAKTAYLETDPQIQAVFKTMMHQMLSLLLAQYLQFYASHWKSRGQAYYGDHLLFERLYGNVKGEVDDLAEKIIGYHGTDAINIAEIVSAAMGWLQKWDTGDDYMSALQSEKDMQALFKQAYEQLKATNLMPLGLDDWIMSVANAHETHCYLLQQRLLDPGRVADKTTSAQLVSQHAMAQSVTPEPAVAPEPAAVDTESPAEEAAEAAPPKVAHVISLYRSILG